jgi:hypothetical protein
MSYVQLSTFALRDLKSGDRKGTFWLAAEMSRSRGGGGGGGGKKRDRTI